MATHARGRVVLQCAIVGLAALLQIPWPPAQVERYYSNRVYPAIQASLTAWSNATNVSLFDVLLIVCGTVWIAACIRWVRRARRQRSWRPLARGLWIGLVGVAAAIVWFAAVWGLNYSRIPLEARIGYDAARVTPAAVRALAERARDGVNRTHDAAHRAGFPDHGEMPPPLVRSLHEVERRLGRPRPTVPGRPKRTLLAWFFRASGVDGMHAPFLLETLVNPALTPPERPVVLAHEWAHLSGHAPEDDASFVGLLAALGADAPSRYSAWLSIFDLAVAQLPRAEQRQLLEGLAPGPRADREAVARRLTARVEPVARASWETYDRYLRAQGVEQGVQSYSRVVQLLVGSGALDRP